MDVLDYFKGDGRPWGVTHSWAGDGQMQCQDGDLSGQFFLVKGMLGSANPWEEFRYDDDFVYRGYDVSPDDGTLYRLSDAGKPASTWIKRNIAPGEWYRREPTVTRYNGAGTFVSANPHVTWLRLKEHHPTWRSGRGLDVPNVIEVQVFDGDQGRDSGTPFETYFFAKGVGMVGWRGSINGHPGQTDVNFIWPAPNGPGVPFLDRERLPGGLSFEVMPGVPVTPPVSPTGAGTAMVIRPDINAKVRLQPTTRSPEIDRIPGGTTVFIVDTVPGRDNDGFSWHQRSEGGYIRADLFVGYAPIIPVTTGVLFAAPVTGYDTTSWHLVNDHKGFDLALPEGRDVTAGGVGQVAFFYICQRCSPGRPNFSSNGITTQRQINAAKNDSAWGFGYGNGVVVRYAYANLPDPTRAALDAMGLQNAYIYAVHGHMSRIDVGLGQGVVAGTRLGLSGNTGNSSGPHVHLETRASMSGNDISIYNRTLINPNILYTIEP